MRVFAKRVFRFDPIVRPLISFRLEEGRDALIKASDPGDVIVLVGTMEKPTQQEDRGRLLGVAEFAPIPIDVSAVIDQKALDPCELNNNGSADWPKAVIIIRAWIFDPKLKLLDVLQEQLTFEATTKAVRLEDGDANAVLKLPKVEVHLPQIPYLKHLRIMTEALKFGRPTTGPSPSDWTGTVSRDLGQRAWTYVMRFGKRDIWKVGHTQDVKARLAEISQHVAGEELGENWSITVHHEWKSSIDAYQMEQRVLQVLSSHRTLGERIRCSEAIILTAWRECLRC